MHELSLCEALVDAVVREAETTGVLALSRVRVEVGELAAADPRALGFCFDAVARGTVAEGARLEIVTAAGRALCRGCSTLVRLRERVAPCPNCGGFDRRILAGTEVRLVEMEAR